MQYLIKLFFIGIILTLSCDEKNLPQDWLVKIDNMVVLKEEFVTRMNYNPYLRSVPDSKEAKNIALASIIAEKILYLESRDCQPCDSLSQSAVNNNLRENMIEQLRIDSVEALVEVNDTELKQEFLKSIYDLKIKFVVFYDQTELESVRSKINSGLSFEAACADYLERMGWQDFAIPEKVVHWRDEKSDFENQLYGLSPGQVSGPMHARAEMYLVKLIEKTANGTDSISEFNKRKNALESRIRNEKISQRYKIFYQTNIMAGLADPDWKKIHRLLDELVERIDFSGTENLTENNTFTDNLNLDVADNIDLYGAEPLVNFHTGLPWNALQLLTALKKGPYSFNYNSEMQFRRSFARNVELLLEHEAIYKLAEELGYNENQRVLEKHLPWKSYFRSNAYRYFKLKKLQDHKALENELKQERLMAFDSLLVQALEKHNVQVNQDAFNELQPDIQTTIIKKSHFSGRLVEPPLEPLSGFPLWTNAVKDILMEVN